MPYGNRRKKKVQPKNPLFKVSKADDDDDDAMVLELEWNADLDQTSAANAMLESKFFNYAK